MTAFPDRLQKESRLRRNLLSFYPKTERRAGTYLEVEAADKKQLKNNE